MALVTIPSSKDIYIEVNGKKLAVAQSYKSIATRESREVEAFGSVEPVGTISGRIRYQIQLSRITLVGQMGDGVDFYSLEDLNLVVVKPDRKIIYSGCQWSEISEAINLSEPVIESATMVAAKRMELR